MTRALITLATLCLVLVPAAEGGRGIRVLPFAQQYTTSTAAIGATITISKHIPGRGDSRPARRPTGDGHASTASPSVEAGGAGKIPPPSYPTLPASSPLLQSSAPFGAGTFWYPDGAGHDCAYVANASPTCYTIITTGSGAAPVIAAPSPAVIAAGVADRLALTPGRIQASPDSVGLTGAASWFWLSPAPQPESLSVTLGGEAVTVTAQPQIEWRFGDGAALSAGAGVPYSLGVIPADAVTHVYATRCLPGDQGSNPYVLPSCGSEGYAVVALVQWQIAYQASGAETESGPLPTRTTTTTANYPVSEARAFLTGGAAE